MTPKERMEGCWEAIEERLEKIGGLLKHSAPKTMSEESQIRMIRHHAYALVRETGVLLEVQEEHKTRAQTMVEALDEALEGK